MKKPYILTAIALAVLALPSAAFADDNADDFSLKFRGFGTLGTVHSSSDTSDYRASVTQEKGAGYSKSWDWGVDSNLGLQADATFGSKLSGVLQVVSQRQYNNSYSPEVEWANIKYQVIPDFSIRAGRVALPAFLVSDYRKVGYANPTIRPPIEVYNQVIWSHLDGLDATYKINLGPAATSIQVYGGRAESKVPVNGEINNAVGKDTVGVNGTVEIGAATLRAGYVSTKLSYTGTSLNALFNGYRNYAALINSLFPTQAAQATSLANNYEAVDKKASFIDIGAQYDPGNWFVQSEFTKRKTDSFVADTTGWYFTGGVRLLDGKVTPYASYSKVKTNSNVSEAGISTAGLPTSGPYAPYGAIATAGANRLNYGLNSVLQLASFSQNDVALGVRWDFMKNTALKVQWDRLSLDNNGAGNMLTNFQPGFNPSDKVNVYSAAIDFVF